MVRGLVESAMEKNVMKKEKKHCLGSWLRQGSIQRHPPYRFSLQPLGADFVFLPACDMIHLDGTV